MSNAIKNNGGPAFPTPDTEVLGGVSVGNPGMSLRDWFAGKALQGMAQWRQLKEIESQEDVASTAYSVADAMLAERIK